jgi:hypothetical protein
MTAGQYTFNLIYLNDVASPVTNPVVTVRVTDEESGEQYDFSDGTWKAVAIQPTANMVQDTAQLGRFYYVFDISNWGTRRVLFYGLAESDDAATYATEERVNFFQSNIYPTAPGLYVTVDQVRTFGITADIVSSDVDVLRLIAHAGFLIDKYTGWWFDKRTLELDVPFAPTYSGYGFRTIYGRGFGGGRVRNDGLAEIILPNFLIALTGIKVNGYDLDISRYELWNNIPLDYEDPRLFINATLFPNDVLKISGDWGCVASVDGAILETVQRATLLTIANILGFETRDGELEEDPFAQFIVQEVTDRHSYTLSSKNITAALANPTASILPMSARMLLQNVMAPRVIY